MNYYNLFKKMQVTDKIVKLLYEYMDESKMTPGNKAALRNLFNSNTSKIEDIFREAFAEDYNRWQEETFAAKIMKQEYEDKADELKKMTEQVEELRREKAELENKYPDPRARQAVVLWYEMMKPYHESDNDYIKRNAVHSAGSIVAAYLGGKDSSFDGEIGKASGKDDFPQDNPGDYIQEYD